VIDPAPAAPPANEKEYPQANGCRCKANDQKDTSNSTGVVEESITHEYIDIIYQSKGLTEKWCPNCHWRVVSDLQSPR
jgi:hypothetical protein